jgi:hypothetical protein
MKISKLIYTSTFLMLIAQFSFGQGMKVKPGTNVTINTSTTLKVAGGGDFTVEDNETYSPSLVEKGSLAFSGGGELKVQQYLEKSQWHIISSPMTSQTIEPYTGMYLYSYDETSDSWQNLYQLTDPLNAGEGYFVWPVTGNPDIIKFKGTGNKSDINVTLTVTPSTNNSGWNLIGNPFPCVVDWNGDASWNLNNVSSTIYLYDYAAGNYKTWNFNTGTGTNGKTNGYIAATQGFWVRTSDTTGSQSSYSLTIPQSQRVASPSTGFYKNGTVEENMLRLAVHNNTYSDECVIAFNEQATDGFDNDFDAYKLNTKVQSPKIYTISGNTKQAVNFMTSVENHKTVAVGFRAGADGEFTLNISGMDSFPADLPVYLEDTKDGNFQNLRENPEYTFTSTIMDDQDRFVIHFANVLGVDDPDGLLENMRIYSWKNSVIVNAPSGFTGVVEVYDLPGKMTASSKISEGKNTITINTSKGYYIVKVVGNNGIKTQKVFIQ